MDIITNIELWIRTHNKALHSASFLYNIFSGNKIKGKRVRLWRKGAFMSKCRIINGGGYNELIVEEGCRLKKCCFRFFGENNRIIIKNDCKLIELDVWCSEGSTIIIHNNTHIVGNVHMAAIERTKISVGKECLFSSEIVIRTGDSHSILNSNGNRINESRDILIDDHVWIGQRVTILKGAVIGKDCVIGTGSIVTGNIFEKGSIIAGVPSKIVKSGITWHHELL